MADVNLRDAFESQLKQLAEIAAKSTAPSITATWIAASDEKVRELLFRKFDEGHTLQGVTTTGYRRPSELGVVFVLDRPQGAMNLIPASVLVSVDLQTKRVIQIADPYVGDESGSSIASSTIPPAGRLPFAMAIPTNAPRVVVSDAARASYRSAEQAFFRARGIQPGRGGFPGDPMGPGRPGFPWPLPPGRLPRPGEGIPTMPSAAETRYWAMTESPCGTETETTTDDPPKSDDGMTDVIADDNDVDWVPFD